MTQLGNENISKLIVKYSIPAIISMFINAIYNIVDQIYIGWGIGELGIAATNITFPLVTICMAVALLFGTGGAANISLHLGKGENEKANRLAGNAISLLILGGIVISVVSILFLDPLLGFFGTTDAVMPLARAYTLVIAFGIPLMIFSMGGSQIIRADGSPSYSMAAMIVGAAFNLIFDPIFLFVFDMGIEGIALATILGQLLSSIMVAYYFLKKTKMISIKLKEFRLEFHNIRTIGGLGMAASFNQLAMTVVQIVMNNTLIYYGAMSAYGSEIPLAVVGAISKINMLFMVVILGVAQGCQPIVGYNYGAKKYDRVKQTYKTGVIAVTIYAVVAFACFQIFPAQIISIFGIDNPDYYEFGVKYIHIFMAMIFLAGAQAFTSNFFTSIGKSVLGLVMSMTRQIIILVPLLVILPRFYGIDGALYAGPISDFSAFILTLFFIMREMRKMKEDEDGTEQATLNGSPVIAAEA